MTVDEETSVSAIIQKLTPFFLIIAPSTPAQPSQATVPADPKTSKKRKAATDPTDTDSTEEIPRKKRKEDEVQSASQLRPATQVEALTASRSTSTESANQASAQQARDEPSSPPSASTDLEAHAPPPKPASVSPAPITEPPTLPVTNEQDRSDESPVRLSPAEESASARLSREFEKPLLTRPTSIDSSVESVEAEIDLLPRSPLIDTTTPLQSQVFTQTQVVRLGAYPSLMGLDFGDDVLSEAFPPMMTRRDEEAERLRRRIDQEEWEGGMSDSGQDVSLPSFQG